MKCATWSRRADGQSAAPNAIAIVTPIRLLALLLALCLCAGRPAWAQAPGAVPKVLRIASESETGFDPARVGDVRSFRVIAHIFDTLLRYDPLARPVKLVPWAAAALPESSDDFRTWTVRVKPGMFACTTDEDCVKVSRGGCCTGWQGIAVNASRAEDYAAQNACKPPYPACAPPPRDMLDADARKVAKCRANACVLEEPATCQYGGSTYSVGDTFPSTDGCNSCSCLATGSVVCTQRACAAQCVADGGRVGTGGECGARGETVGAASGDADWDMIWDGN